MRKVTPLLKVRLVNVQTLTIWGFYQIEMWKPVKAVFIMYLIFLNLQSVWEKLQFFCDDTQESSIEDGVGWEWWSHSYLISLTSQSIRQPASVTQVSTAHWLHSTHQGFPSNHQDRCGLTSSGQSVPCLQDPLGGSNPVIKTILKILYRTK